MLNSVPVLLLGIVIISTIGSVFGYLLEPGRFDKQGAEPAVSHGAEATQCGERPPRLAA